MMFVMEFKVSVLLSTSEYFSVSSRNIMQLSELSFIFDMSQHCPDKSQTEAPGQGFQRSLDGTCAQFRFCVGCDNVSSGRST